MTADAAAVDPRLTELDGRVIDQIADLEVVRAVENEVGVVGEIEDIGAVDVGDDGSTWTLELMARELAARPPRLWADSRRHRVRRTEPGVGGCSSR